MFELVVPLLAVVTDVLDEVGPVVPLVGGEGEVVEDNAVETPVWEFALDAPLESEQPVEHDWSSLPPVLSAEHEMLAVAARTVTQDAKRAYALGNTSGSMEHLDMMF